MIVVRNTPEDLNKQLSLHFRAEEFRCRCGKCKITLVSGKLIKNCDSVRRIWGRSLRTTSGYRCQEYNRSLPGSADYSWHMSGHAVDFLKPQSDIEHLVMICRSIFPYVEEGDDYIHCDTRGNS